VKKRLLAILLILAGGAIFAEEQLLEVTVFYYAVDGQDCTDDVSRALFVWDTKTRMETLSIYGKSKGKGEVLLQRITVTDWHLSDKDEGAGWEVGYWAKAEAAGAPAADKFIAVAEYDDVSEFYYWQVINVKDLRSQTLTPAIAVEFY
jgi:hypothetical protein